MRRECVHASARADRRDRRLARRHTPRHAFGRRGAAPDGLRRRAGGGGAPPSLARRRNAADGAGRSSHRRRSPRACFPGPRWPGRRPSPRRRAHHAVRRLAHGQRSRRRRLPPRAAGPLRRGRARLPPAGQAVEGLRRRRRPRRDGPRVRADEGQVQQGDAHRGGRVLRAARRRHRGRSRGRLRLDRDRRAGLAHGARLRRATAGGQLRRPHRRHARGPDLDARVRRQERLLRVRRPRRPSSRRGAHGGRRRRPHLRNEPGPPLGGSHRRHAGHQRRAGLHAAPVGRGAASPSRCSTSRPISSCSRTAPTRRSSRG